jgi:hypothetical protein
MKLLSQGAALNVQNAFGNTPLHEAIYLRRTAHLLAHIATPNIPIEKLLKIVRLGVMKETAGQQMPWQTSSLIGDFYFNRQE